MSPTVAGSNRSRPPTSVRRARTIPTRRDNKYLSWAYLEAAHFALRSSPEIKRWYQRKVARCGGRTVIARKAVAAKLGKAAYYMMKNQEAFKIEQVFG